MHAFFEDTGKLLTGKILSSTDTACQIELSTGKRLKVKLPMVYLQFQQIDPSAFADLAQKSAMEMDVGLAWEFAPEGEFGFADLAKEYFSDQPSPIELAASLLCLHGAPHYFRRAGKGRFKKADAQTVKLALAAIEKRQQVQAEIESQAQALCEGRCPENIKTQIYRILFKPDKNSPEYKAVALAAKISQRSLLDLLQSSGAIASAYDFHWQRFLFTHFPHGVGFGSEEQLKQLGPDGFSVEDLPKASVRAFSIDDSSTSEIDDALSVQGLGSGRVRLGVHIAAPALALERAGKMDAIARQRLSTVYMPGAKITMLPQQWIQVFSLDENQHCPAISFYADFDEQTLECLETKTSIEQVWIEKNLRHDVLEKEVNEETIVGLGERPEIPFAAELAFLFRLACDLKRKREEVRGKPEVFSRPDYSFKIRPRDEGPDQMREQSKEFPSGNLALERIEILPRQRGTPLDLIVAECMVLVNSHWGLWMAALGVPAIYRSQASMAPGMKVRMGLKALPHAGMGVKAYAWCSSPLRRYVDLLNQQQLIACARHGATAALAVPYKPKDADLFAIVNQFDETYRSYSAFQQSMERYWTLRYLEQEDITSLQATHLKEGLCRATHLPLLVQAAGAVNLPRGTVVNLRIQSIDLMNLEVHTSLLAVLDSLSDTEAGDSLEDEAEEEAALEIPAVDLIDSMNLEMEDAQTSVQEAEPASPTSELVVQTMEAKA